MFSLLAFLSVFVSSSQNLTSNTQSQISSIFINSHLSHTR